ncbi:MAG: glycosyltransferase family 1 protein [Candidatus Andersenbacteria bacterium]
MKIAIDARAILWTGIATYVKNLLLQYAATSSSHQFVVLIPDRWEQQARKTIGKLPEQFTLVPVTASYYSWQEQTIFLRQLNALDVDFVHFTHFNVPLLYRKPYVVTIHDATRFIFPGQKHQHLLKQLMYEVVFSRAVARACHVIFVTEHTRREVEALPLSLPKNSSVIYEGIHDRFFEPIGALQRQKVRSLIGTSNPYLLYVGVWMSHKNIRRILDSFVELRNRYPDLKLVITGKPVPGYTNALRYAQRLNVVDHVIFPGYVSNELLPALYSEAACFVFPSLYEGFGLPPLEAAACGTPVVTSNVSSLPEVMGFAAVYVNPESIRSITMGVRMVLDNPSERRAYVEKGKNQAARFSWELAAQQHLGVYEEAGA